MFTQQFTNCNTHIEKKKRKKTLSKANLQIGGEKREKTVHAKQLSGPRA